MERQVFSFLLCLFCSLHAPLMGVTAEPTVTATILTPEADRKEGGMVHMRCVAYNVEPDQVVDWLTEIPEFTLRYNTTTVTTNRRFQFETTHVGNAEVIQDFRITDLHIEDTNEYVCTVTFHMPMTGRERIVATSRVMLTVLYFPNESSPICSPDGPITVDNGTELNMRCSSETGNSAVMTAVSENTTRCDTYTWTKSTINDRIEMSMNLTVDAADDNTSFECTITSVYYPGITRSCSIGPIRVTGGTDLIQDTPTGCSKPSVTSNVQTPLSGEDKLCSSVPWIAAFIISFILLVLACFIITFLILRNFKLKRLIENLNEKIAPPPKSDPYMELEPTDDKNREYMEPEARETTTGQHTYYQTIEGEKEHTEDDYEVTDDNTTYETVVETKNDEKEYQNIKQ